MANTVINVFFPEANQLLKLELYPDSGGSRANTAVNLTQPDGVNDPYHYQLTITDNLSGWFKAWLLRQGGSVPLAGGDVYLNPDAGPYAVGLRAAPPVVVDRLTEAAKTSLQGIVLTPAVPSWLSNLACFDRPIVQGDDYSGNRALEIPVSGWPGRDPLTASAIVLTGRQVVKSSETAAVIIWPGTAVADGDGFILRFTPTYVQTEVAAGTYLFDVQATWSAGQIETIVLPGARLQIAEDYSP